MKTHLLIRWQRGANEYSQSVWERENDGKLYVLYTMLFDLLSSLGNPVANASAGLLDQPNEET